MVIGNCYTLAEMFKPVGVILGNRRFGKSSGAVLALQVRRVAQDVIGKVCSDLPEEILTTIKVKTYKNGAATIACPQMVAGELYMRSEGLKKGMNDKLGKNVVEQIKFKAE